MATRSAIAYYTNDQKIRAAYCHFDGYLECNGHVLLNKYTGDWSKVEKLVEGGAMSSLGDTIEDTEYYTKRGEDLHVETFDSEEEYIVKMKDMGCEYFYLYVHDMEYDKNNPHWHYASLDVPEFSPVY